MRKWIVCAIFLSAVSAAADDLTAADLDRRRKALDELLAEQWEYTLRTQPEFASILGDRRYNDQLADVSEKAVLADVAMKRRFLTRFKGIGAAGFSVQEKLNRDLMIANLSDAIEGAKFKPWQMPVNQMNGFHIDAPQMAVLLPFATVKDYDDYTVRLGKFPKVFADTTANMRKGMAAGLMQPKFILEKVAEQAAEIASATPEKSPFAEPLEKLPESFSGEDKQRIRANPYSDYGRLNDEMLRAIRLVVDTGLHAKGWTRDQVVQYFRDHSAVDEVEIQSETDRYIAWPGQALSYKIGQLTILRLREHAQQELGAKFDIRAVHDEVLGAGALPMKLLEERIDAWIARVK